MVLQPRSSSTLLPSHWERCSPPASGDGVAGTGNPSWPGRRPETRPLAFLKSPFVRSTLSPPPPRPPHPSGRDFAPFVWLLSGFPEPGRRGGPRHGEGPRGKVEAVEIGIWGRNSEFPPPWRIPPFPVGAPPLRPRTVGSGADPPLTRPRPRFPSYLSLGAAAPRARARAPGSDPAAAGPACPGRRPSPRPALPGGIPFKFGIRSIPNVKDPKTSVPRGVPRRGGGGKPREGLQDSHPRVGRGRVRGRKVPSG